MATGLPPTGLNRRRFVPKMTGGKRGPSEPIATTSDEEETCDSWKDGQTEGPPEARKCIDSPLQSPVSPVGSVDYENVSSPGDSSTASGPVYVRQPGFTHHAHEVTKPKSKKKKTLTVTDRLSTRTPEQELAPKARPKKDPLPMRLRALPQSFWQQPNTPNYISPATCFATLPPLKIRDSDEDVTDVRPITPPEDRETCKKVPSRPSQCRERKITVADTDQLFRLFDVIENKTSRKSVSQGNFKRGRPRKVFLGKSTKQGLLSGNDPHLADAVTEKMFPNLSLEHRQQMGCSGQSSLHMITLETGDKPISLPSLSIEQNYSQMLSELVMHI
ncbi:uncharacterized protein LOC135475896 [Liolophura sinensis]|uniref:uncharacterized protein LOC135475896 n=1 Tax=Liolophura sinensis TaxID=3198878 RepID=UPI003158F417